MDEGRCAPFKPQQTEGGTSPLWNPPSKYLIEDRREKSGHQFTNMVKRAMLQPFRINKYAFRGWGVSEKRLGEA